MLGQEEAAPQQKVQSSSRGCSLFQGKEAPLAAPPHPQLMNTAGPGHRPAPRAQPHTPAEMCAPKGPGGVAIWWFAGRQGRRKFSQRRRPNVLNVTPAPTLPFTTLPFFRCVGMPRLGQKSQLKTGTVVC